MKCFPVLTINTICDVPGLAHSSGQKEESRRGSSALWKEEGSSFLHNVDQWRARQKAGQIDRVKGRIKENGKKSPGKGTKGRRGEGNKLLRPADLFLVQPAGPSMHENRVFFSFTPSV